MGWESDQYEAFYAGYTAAREGHFEDYDVAMAYEQWLKENAR